ncbi:MAG: fibro-slime domain-containing protein [Solirubrobacterales bacterium]
MRRTLMTSVLLAAITTIPAVSHANITLDATLRDFSDSHPDFQGHIATERGLVAGTIGEDRKPVYAGGAGTQTTSGAANFDQWYNDVPGVNMSVSYDMVLTEVDPGLYAYVDRSFFPIDRQLLGNDGRFHNYHFTMELHCEFTYEPGQTFRCAGDDDVFVFIDDRKVIDLGGVHTRQSGAVNLDTLGLTAGEEYAFDLFFAERHAIWSVFEMQTSIALEPVGSVEPAEQPTAPAPGAALLGVFGTGLVVCLRGRRSL